MHDIMKLRILPIVFTYTVSLKTQRYNKRTVYSNFLILKDLEKLLHTGMAWYGMERHGTEGACLRVLFVRYNKVTIFFGCVCFSFLLKKWNVTTSLSWTILRNEIRNARNFVSLLKVVPANHRVGFFQLAGKTYIPSPTIYLLMYYMSVM